MAFTLIFMLFTGCSADTDSPQIAESQRETTKPTPVSTIGAENQRETTKPTPVSTIGAKVDAPTPTGLPAPPKAVGNTPTESPSFLTAYVVGGRRSEALICTPDGDAPFPALVYNHGLAVDLHGHEDTTSQGLNLKEICDALSEAGYLVVAPIRRSSDKDLKSHQREVEDAIEYMSGRQDVASERISLMGVSRGALLTLLIGIEREDLYSLIILAPASDGKRFRKAMNPVAFIGSPVLVLVDGSDDSDILQNFEMLKGALTKHYKPYEAIRYDQGRGRKLFWNAGPWLDDVTAFIGGIGTQLTAAATPSRQTIYDQGDCEVKAGNELSTRGPYFQQMYQAFSSDGITFTPENVMVLDHVSVPDAVRRPNGEIWVYAENGRPGLANFMVAMEGESGQWEFEDCVRFDGEIKPDVKDPNIVQLDDGRFRLFYGRSLTLGWPLRPIYTAISEDGLDFLEEGTAIEAADISDPSVVQLPDGSWMMALEHQGTTLLAESSDGLSFQLNGVEVSAGGIPELFILPEGRLGLVLTGSELPRMVSDDLGQTWTQVTGPSVDDGFNPTVTVKADGTYVMFYQKWSTVPKSRIASQRVRPVEEARERWEGSGPDGDASKPVIAENYDNLEVLEVRGGGFRLFGVEQESQNIISFFSDDGLEWVSENGVRLSNASWPDAVLLDDDRVRLYFQRGGAINSAVSSDGGLTFIEEPGTRISMESHGTADTSKIGPSTTVRMPDDTFRMYYRADYEDGYYFKGLKTTLLSAVSENGLEWTPDKGIRIAPNDWVHPGYPEDRRYLDSPEAVLNSDGQMSLYFWGMGMCYGVCLTMSEDGLHFDTVQQVLPAEDLYNGAFPEDLTILFRGDSAWLMYFRLQGKEADGVFVAKRTELSP